MGTVDPEKVSEAELTEGRPGYAPSEAGPSPSDRVPGRPSRLRRIALTAGIAAGLVSWLVGEAIYGTFAPPPELSKTINFSMSSRLARAQSVANIKNATLNAGVLGAVLGMALGVAGGVARRSTRAGVVAGAVGLVLGGAVAAQMAWALTPIAERNRILASESLVFAFLIHVGVWSAIGAVGGLAFGLGLGGRSTVLRAMLGGFVGASLGTAAYELLGALAFPMAGTSGALSTIWVTRLLALLLVTLPGALGSALALEVQAPRARTGPASPPA
jgi:hypothetical protein